MNTHTSFIQQTCQSARVSHELFIEQTTRCIMPYLYLVLYRERPKGSYWQEIQTYNKGGRRSIILPSMYRHHQQRDNYSHCTAANVTHPLPSKLYLATHNRTGNLPETYVTTTDIYNYGESSELTVICVKYHLTSKRGTVSGIHRGAFNI